MMDVVSSALRSAGFLGIRTAKMESPMAGFSVGVFTFAVFLVLCAVLGSFFTVKTAQVAVITRFGKFLRVADPGSELEMAVHRYSRRQDKPARQSDYIDDGDKDEGQRVRHHSHFRSKSGSSRKSVRCVLQTIEPRGTDSVLCRASHPRTCSGHDSRRGVCQPVGDCRRREAGAGCRYGRLWL